jgi:hypothetical protein
MSQRKKTADQIEAEQHSTLNHWYGKENTLCSKNLKDFDCEFQLMSRKVMQLHVSEYDFVVFCFSLINYGSKKGGEGKRTTKLGVGKKGFCVFFFSFWSNGNGSFIFVVLDHENL